jgi:conjugative transposon TraN protein
MQIPNKIIFHLKLLMMKSLCTLWILFFSIHSFSQTTVPSFPVSICVNKTSNLIFPYPIISVDRGSLNVIAQKARGTENILQLKALKEYFPPTNLSVITRDGRLFSFMITYTPDPAALNISFAGDSSTHLSDNQIQLTAEKLNDAIVTDDASILLKLKHFLHLHFSASGIRLILHGIYIKDQLLWFNFEILNNSFLNYNPAYLHCYIQDKTKAARSAIQETEVQVVYPQALILPVPGKKKSKFALAFAPFTFPDDKKMIVELSEKNGGRPLKFSVGSKPILKARLVK